MLWNGNTIIEQIGFQLRLIFQKMVRFLMAQVIKM